ncbi:signal transduction histidine kinase [Burkholderiales bacterium JOSHI_001]|nr:signal transduction histidine kinase [Burkholderiales bacterium JOSHI_001]
MHRTPARPKPAELAAPTTPTAQRKAPRPAAAEPAPKPPHTGELQAVLEGAGVALAYFRPDGTLRFANAALAEWLQPGGAAPLGRTLAELGQALRTRLREPQLVAEEGWLLRRLDNPDRRIAPLAMADGRWLRLQLKRCPQGGVVLSGRDVTHEVEVDRMRSEFLSTAAHELRNPMASILGFAELLMTRSLPTAQTQELAGIIHRQSTWLVGMVNELLDLARIESRRGKDFRPKLLTLQPWLSYTLAAMGPDAARVTLALPAPTLLLCVDEAKARQAVSNVLSNALKYSPQGGPVRLTVREETRQQAAGVAIVVQDQGIGMDAASVARIFERFYRADPSGSIPGTGLGMSLVQEIMNLHRGDVQVHSQPGQGTTVTLWFPAAAPEKQATSE